MPQSNFHTLSLWSVYPDVVNRIHMLFDLFLHRSPTSAPGSDLLQCSWMLPSHSLVRMCVPILNWAGKKIFLLQLIICYAQILTLVLLWLCTSFWHCVIQSIWHWTVENENTRKQIPQNISFISQTALQEEKALFLSALLNKLHNSYGNLKSSTFKISLCYKAWGLVSVVPVVCCSH